MYKIIRIIFAVSCLVFCLLSFAACSSGKSAADDEELTKSISGKTFVWEKDGFGGDFTITLDEDGRYEFYEGMLSSYIGSGDWTVSDGVLIMTEDKENGYDMTFRFTVKDGELVFIKNKSSRFIYTEVENGDRFLEQKD